MDTFNEVIMKQGGVSNTSFNGKNIGIVYIRINNLKMFYIKQRLKGE
jgi:hypothetical protein